MAEAKIKDWKVVRGRFVLPGGEKMQAGCNHRPGRFGGCGGCFARFYVAMTEIERGGDAKKIAASVFDEMKAENAERKAARHG